ncbi:MAG: hypothetical protein IPF59_08990 [Ignavibacteria bacterium]|nr:hypothetical protein [Ignavibacteria bacterium]
MIATYDSILELVQEPKSLPYIGDVREGVDNRLTRLQTIKTTSYHEGMIPEDHTRKIIKGLFGLYYYFKYGKIMPSN